MKRWASRDWTNLKSTDLCGINITTPKYGLLYHFNVIQSRDLCTGHLAQIYGHLKDISFWKPSKGIGSIINMGTLHPCHDIIRDLLNVANPPYADMDKQKLSMFFLHIMFIWTINFTFNPVWPFQARIKAIKSVWRILEVSNKRGYWTYVGILILRQMEFWIFTIFNLCDCSLKWVV